MKKRYILLILVILFGVLFWIVLKSPADQLPTPVVNNVNTNLNPDPPKASKDDLIIVDTPLPGASVSSPLVVKGKARGNWYFEASFPIELRDSDGTLLWQGPAQAQGEWMTTDYVPFSVTIPYTTNDVDRTGYLILHKDNASGEPQFDNSLTIKVTL